MNKICVSLEAQTPETFLKQLVSLQSEHDFFELRLDSLLECNVESVRSLLNQVAVPVIATIRSKAEGGKFEGSLEEQAELVKVCMDSSAEYVDIEVTLLEQFPELISERSPETVLISHHNFDETPDESELQRIIERMKKRATKSIYKIACMAKNAADVVRLTELQKSLEPGRGVIIAMGEQGQLLRLLGPSLGAFTSFASASEQSVASGQLYYKKMKQLMDAMELEDGRQ